MAWFNRMRSVIRKGDGNPYRDALGRFTDAEHAVIADSYSSGFGAVAPAMDDAMKSHVKAAVAHNNAAKDLAEADPELAGLHKQASEAHQGAQMAQEWAVGLSRWNTREDWKGTFKDPGVPDQNNPERVKAAQAKADAAVAEAKRLSREALKKTKERSEKPKSFLVSNQNVEP